jgi:MFS family permease
VGRLLIDLRPVRESPPFRRLLAGSTLSAVGDSMTSFAVILQVFVVTHSSFAVGAIGIARVVPTLIVGLLGGSLVDAFDRRRLVLLTTSCLAVVSAALAAQAFAGLDDVWLLYGLVAVQSALSAINAPARQTFVPRLLRADQLAAGLALNRLSFQVMLVIGPALAGLITTAGGLRACYLADTISFAAALYGIAGLPTMRPHDDVGRPGLRAAAEGIRFIGRSRVLAGAFLTDLSATVFGLPVALFPAINAERFGGSASTLGLFTAAIGFGGLISSVLSGPVGHVRRQGLAMLVSASIWGAAFAGFALAPYLWLALGLLGVAGAADTFTVVFRSAIVQSVTPERFRGRVLAADYVVGAGGGELGNIEAGTVGSLASPTIGALSGGLATIASAAVISIILPAFARYIRQPAAAEPPAAEQSLSEPDFGHKKKRSLRATGRRDDGLRAGRTRATEGDV